MTISEVSELSSVLLLSEVIRYHFEKSTKLKIFSRVAISETNELSRGLKLSVVILKKKMLKIFNLYICVKQSLQKTMPPRVPCIWVVKLPLSK